MQITDPKELSQLEAILHKFVAQNIDQANYNEDVMGEILVANNILWTIESYQLEHAAKEQQ